MTKAIQLLTRLPFEGFYNSIYSDAVDQAEARWVEYECDPHDKEREAGQPEALRLNETELHDLLFRHTDYSACYHLIARWYVEGFSRVAGEALDLDLGLAFESMDSPREYNFSTDRVYAHVPLKVVRALFKASKAEDHATLKRAIAESFTSRSGFISHYSNDIEDWVSKPLTDWDHNELCTLIEASLERVGWRDEDLELYYATFGDEGDWRAWEEGVNWPAFEAAREEARDDKLAAIEDNMSDEEKAERMALLDWRSGLVWTHPDQQPLL